MADSTGGVHGSAGPEPGGLLLAGTFQENSKREDSKTGSCLLARPQWPAVTVFAVLSVWLVYMFSSQPGGESDLVDNSGFSESLPSNPSSPLCREDLGQSFNLLEIIPWFSACSP